MFRTHLRSLSMLCLFAVGLLGFSLTAQAQHTLRVQSQTDCYVYADLAISARAMASLNVPVDTTRAWIGMVYSLPEGDPQAIAEKVLLAAYRSGAEPKTFAGALAAICLATGNMSDLLGNDT